MRKALSPPLVSYEMQWHHFNPHRQWFILFRRFHLSLAVVNCSLRMPFNELKCDRIQYILVYAFVCCVLCLCARAWRRYAHQVFAYIHLRIVSNINARTHTHTPATLDQDHDRTMNLCAGFHVRLLLYHKLFVRNAVGMRTHFSGIFGMFEISSSWWVFDCLYFIFICKIMLVSVNSIHDGY